MTPPLLSMYQTFATSVKSIGSACTLTAVGMYIRRRGFVENEGKRTLALLCQQISFPLYLFTKILYCNQDWSDKPCPDVTRSLKDVWILLFWPFYVVAIGIIVGYLMAIVTNTPQKQVKLVVACCAFANSTALPITLLAVIHSNFPSTSDLGRIDPTLFLSVYLLLYPALQWGLGGWMLAPEEFDDTTDTQSSFRNVSGLLHQNVLNNRATQEFYRSYRRGLSSADEGQYVSELDLNGLLKRHEEFEKDFSQRCALITTEEESEDMFHDELEESAHGDDSPLRLIEHATYGSTFSNEDMRLREALSKSFRSKKDGLIKVNNKFDTESARQTIQNIIDRCFQPPVVGSLLGILAAITPVRGYFVDIVDRASHAPLQWLFDGLYSVGQTAVPINMMILGCYLSTSDKGAKSEKDDTAPENKDAQLSVKTSIGIILGKLVIIPAVGIVSAIMLKYYVLDIPDEIACAFYIVLMIVFLTPTANNVIIMIELSGSNAKEATARVIALQYIVAPLILSVTMTIAIGVSTNWT